MIQKIIIYDSSAADTIEGAYELGIILGCDDIKNKLFRTTLKEYSTNYEIATALREMALMIECDISGAVH